MAKKRYVKDGDTELWAVKNADWALPVFCHPISSEGQPMFLVQVADSISHEQFMALDGVMKPFPVAGDKWMCPRDEFSKFASKAQGITPSAYVVWNGNPSGPDIIEVDESIPIQEGSDRFIEWVWSNYKPTSNKASLLIAWVALKNAMLEWVLIKKHPLPLGFCTITAIPFRANWKHFLDVKFGHMDSAFKEPPEKRDAILAQTDWDDHLLDTAQIAMSLQDMHIYWTLEVAPEGPFIDRVKDYESTIRIKNGDVGYANYFKNLIARVKGTIADVYSSYVVERSRPVAKLGLGIRGSGQTLLPHNAPSRMVPNHPTGGRIPANLLLDPEGKPLQPELVGGEVEHMPDVSRLQREIPYVRQGGRDDA